MVDCMKQKIPKSYQNSPNIPYKHFLFLYRVFYTKLINR